MLIKINGEARELKGPVSVAGLLILIEVPQRKVAVERNREIVPKSQFDEVYLAEGDALEIVQFVGGG